jgi:hypothetical protein
MEELTISTYRPEGGEGGDNFLHNTNEHLLGPLCYNSEAHNPRRELIIVIQN